jgi:NAD(P)H-dependent flavin oxidoreductase YrpB (nitropropane dioxygenase family)
MATRAKSPLHTTLRDLRGIRYPIGQAGMGWVARQRLGAEAQAVLSRPSAN